MIPCERKRVFTDSMVFSKVILVQKQSWKISKLDSRVAASKRYDFNQTVNDILDLERFDEMTTKVQKSADNYKTITSLTLL